MAFSVDQTATIGTDGNGSDFTVTCQFNTLPSVNGFIIVTAFYAFEQMAVTISDASGNSYVEAGSSFLVSGPKTVIYRTNLGGLKLPGSPPLVISLASSNNFASVTARSYTSSVQGTLMADVNATGSATSTGAPPVVCSTGVPHQANQLFVGGYVEDDAAPSTVSITGDLTAVNTINDGSNGECGGMADLIASDALAHSTTFSWSTGDAPGAAVIVVPFFVNPNILYPQSGKLAAIKRAGTR